MERIIAHSDLNCFYASVEMLRNPRLRDVPFAVCGSTEKRHGIVLTANYPAKRSGVKVAMANWQARQACPGLYMVSPHMNDYIQFSGFVRELYNSYTDRVEPFGLDECWLDLTGCVPSFEKGVKVVNDIRERVKRELGLTVSIGLSDNKVFAKLGSDLKKPDAVTLIPRHNFKEIVWSLPVGDLLYVGRATKAKLEKMGIYTIGSLAKTDERILKNKFGKIGELLYSFANGMDCSSVALAGSESPIKSIGNSTTCPRDLKTDQDVKIIIYALSESVGARMMELELRAKTIEFHYVNSDLTTHGSSQCKVEIPTNISKEIAEQSFRLFKQCYSNWTTPLRKIGVRCCDLVSRYTPRQLGWEIDANQLERMEGLEQAVNILRKRYGNKIVQRAIMLTDTDLSGLDAKKDHTVHPVGLLKDRLNLLWNIYAMLIIVSGSLWI